MEAAHPKLYYGDGHNRLFESRGGYGQACGTGDPEQADGDIEGWNQHNPGNDEAHDAPFTIVLRPLPVALDPLGFAETGGRREGVADTYAPWLYQLTNLEIKKEGKVDNVHSFDVTEYLFVDVHASGVNGNGDRVCDTNPIHRLLGIKDVHGGFVLRVQTTDGKIHDGPQMTADFFGAEDDWKRLAIPLVEGYAPAEVGAIQLDAYDNDGIFFQ